jgi:small subunit ribosomal protein S16
VFPLQKETYSRRLVRASFQAKEEKMVVIRLSRSGAKKRPFFNIVVTESRHRRDGRFNERIGFYNPMIAEGPQRLTYQEDRLNYWVEKGATMSDTVARIIKTAKKAAAAAPAAAE